VLLGMGDACSGGTCTGCTIFRAEVSGRVDGRFGKVSEVSTAVACGLNVGAATDGGIILLAAIALEAVTVTADAISSLLTPCRLANSAAIVRASRLLASCIRARVFDTDAIFFNPPLPTYICPN